jgi:hypothetical protein
MKGRIYKLTDNTNGNVYYGSTIQEINSRISRHKASYKLYLDGKNRYITSFGIIKNKDYKIELVEENEFETKYDLHERERYYIENNDCVNKVIPNRTIQEYREVNEENITKQNKEYRKKNKENIAEKSKKCYEVNEEYYKKKNKEWRENNKEKIKKYQEYFKEKVSCVCGDIIRRDGLSKHKKSKKHLDKIIQDT